MCNTGVYPTDVLQFNICVDIHMYDTCETHVIYLKTPHM